MPSVELTDKTIRAIQPPAAGRLEVWDTKEAGLILRLSKTGKRTWCLQYKADEFDGKGRRKTKRLTLGPYGAEPPAITLRQARSLAIRAKADIEHGIDPAAQKRTDFEQAREQGRKRNAATVAEAIEDYCSLDADSPSRWKAEERPRLLRKELGGPFGHRGIGEVADTDLVKLQQAIYRRPAQITSNRFVAVARKFFAWAADTYDIDNPSTRLRPLVDERDRHRNRSLSVDDLQTLWSASESLRPASRAFLRFMILTPHRRETIAKLRFSSIDGEGQWRIARFEKKAKRHEQMIPLSQVALAIVEERRQSTSGEYVFATGKAGDVPPSGFSKLKTAIDARLPEDFEPWTFHDLRRSFRTWAPSAGVSREVARKILDHAQGSADVLDAVYDQYRYLDEQREALNAYAEAICA